MRRRVRHRIEADVRLLIVEDSESLADALRGRLSREGYACDHARDAVEADLFLRQAAYDLVVLDWSLPRGDGLSLLRDLRRRGDAARVLMLSARDAVADRVAALDAGADDYMVKPCDLDELLARLRALGRRPREHGDARLEHGGLTIDLHARRARWHGTDLLLSPKEYGLLELLLRERGRVLSRASIFERLYDSASEASDKVVEVIVSTLRQKLAKGGAPDVIQTRRGFGYVVE